MTRGRAIVGVLAAVLAVAAGWAVGRTPGDCEQVCPAANNPCPTPPDCLVHHFNWGAAIVLGAVVLGIILVVGELVLRRNE